VRILRESSSKWTPEFTDKMTTTVCESLAQSGHLGMSRLLLAETLVKSSATQRYKLLLTATMNELLFGDWSIPPLLLDWIMKITPSKAKPMVVILWAKICELHGDNERAFGLFQHAVREYAAEWRVFLELAQFHLHRNDVDHAIRVIAEGLKTHPGSGRLWAFRVQLEAFVRVERQIEMLRKAVHAVPKSGEVWCEAARIALNPLTPYFNLASAKKYLEFAYRFTPQHGDSLVEMLRSEMLMKGPHGDFKEIRKRFLGSEGNYGLLFIFVRKLAEKPLIEVFENAVREVQSDIARNKKVYARAIARSSFVLASIPAEAERLDQMRADEMPAKFAFGLTNVGQMILNPALCQTREETLSVILGSSGIGVGQ
jgi:tetratricopeptide (TPR) repeat protein